MLQTRYITLDEFKEYFGIDLSVDLGSDIAAIGFIRRIEDRISSYIDSNFNRNVDSRYPEFSDYQKEHYKLALLEQAIYIYRNGDISVDSGYDPEKGEIANTQKYFIAPNCKVNLRLCGLWNRNLYGY